MKSILIDEEVHHLLRRVVAENNTNIKYTIHEAIIDIAKKYKISITKDLLSYEVNHE